ncbi:MAG: type II toxin-antitoxin system VapC family toxin [Chthoniobacterales bacterium]
MGRIAVDTSFLIDFERARKSRDLQIQSFLEANQENEFCLSITALGEFAAGFESLREEAYLRVRRSYFLLDHDEIVAWKYREIFRNLKSKGSLIGANDLWIAATALRHEMPLVTRNVREFSRISSLQVLSY